MFAPPVASIPDATPVPPDPDAPPRAPRGSPLSPDALARLVRDRFHRPTFIRPEPDGFTLVTVGSTPLLDPADRLIHQALAAYYAGRAEHAFFAPAGAPDPFSGYPSKMAEDSRLRTNQERGTARWREWKTFQHGAALVTSWAEAGVFGAQGPKCGTPGSSFYSNLRYFMRYRSVPLGADDAQVAIYDALVARLGRPAS